MSILGAEAGNLILRVNATGGLYLGGGMTSRILPLLRTGPFLGHLASKGRDTEFLREVPVRVITNTKVGLIGAALAGLHALAEDP
jgi:glucokinase